MKRLTEAAREDWQSQLEGVGINYHSNGIGPTQEGDGLYWFEGSSWHLSETEVERLEEVTEHLHEICLAAVDHVVTKEQGLLKTMFDLPDWFADYVIRSWRRRDPSLMGRMDLAFDDEAGVIKLLEYNADTPTLAIETGVAQWHWMEQVHPSTDQFNSLHEKLLARFKVLKKTIGPAVLHFTGFRESLEEWAHVTYFRDLAEQAGIETIGLDLAEVGMAEGAFYDLQNNQINFLHKLYPWEWMREDEFGKTTARAMCGILEAPWKAVLSDKAILALLWKLNEGHPNLLPTVMGRQRFLASNVTKPCLGREGANVSIMEGGIIVAESDGLYDGQGKETRWVTQQRAVLPQQDGWNAVIGSWVVGNEAAGVIFRESQNAIVRDTSRVVPHFFT